VFSQESLYDFIFQLNIHHLDYFNVSVVKFRFSAHCHINFGSQLFARCHARAPHKWIRQHAFNILKSNLKFGTKNTHVYRPLSRSTSCIIHSNIIQFSLARNCTASTTSSTASQKLDKSRPEFLKSPRVNKRVNS